MCIWHTYKYTLWHTYTQRQTEHSHIYTETDTEHTHIHTEANTEHSLTHLIAHTLRDSDAAVAIKHECPQSEDPKAIMQEGSLEQGLGLSPREEACFFILICLADWHLDIYQV